MISSGSEAGDGSPGAGQVLRLRMSPHNVAEVSRVEMLADCPIDHPFFVKDKGKCLPGPCQSPVTRVLYCGIRQGQNMRVVSVARQESRHSQDLETIVILCSPPPLDS